jgi:proteasome lid subunit RPN8/RPN11
MSAPSAAPVPRARLILPAAVATDIQSHARATFPDECCGFLLGLAPGEGAASVEVRVAVRAPNAEAGEGVARTRFTIAPALVLAAHKDAARQGLALVGFYHSHPQGGDWPSAHDRALAWPGHVYVIAAGDSLRAFVATAPGAPLEQIALALPGEGAP